MLLALHVTLFYMDCLVLKSLYSEIFEYDTSVMIIIVSLLYNSAFILLFINSLYIDDDDIFMFHTPVYL